MEDNIIIGYCVECNSEITRDDTECYVDDEGYYYDSIECVLEHFNVTKREL